DLPLADGVAFGIGRGPAHPAARAAGQLAGRRGGPPHDPRDVVERDPERVVQDERQRLGGGEGLDHDHRRQADRVREKRLVLGVRAGGPAHGGLGAALLERRLPPRRPRAQRVQAHPPHHRRQPGAEVVDPVAAGAAEPQPRLLHGVVGLGERPQHPVRDRLQLRAVLFEPLGQKVALVHPVPFVRLGHTTDGTGAPDVTVLSGSRAGLSVGGMDAKLAGDMWKAIEPLHAVTYFSEECRTANKEAGLKGYWMGYFASRGAPLGAVSAGTIEATFFGFHPARVRRAIPDAWGFASPERILAVRGAAAARALRRAFPGIEDVAAETAPRLHEAVMAADGAGRALFAANRDLPVPDDPVEALWQAATALREHRGDGHVAVLTAEGLDGVEANVLAAAVGSGTAQWLRESRGWSQEEWDAAVAALTERGLLANGDPTEEGRALKARIEQR